MTGLAQYYTTVFGLPVTIAEPWRGIRYDQKLREAIGRMGTSYSVALGLALRGIERQKQKSADRSLDQWIQTIKKKLSAKIG